MCTFGRIIKKLRVEREWSHDRLARESGLSKGGVIAHEKLGTPKIREITLAAYARAFGLKSDDLLSLYHEAVKQQPPKAEITVADSAGNVVKLPPETVSRFTALATKEGKPLADWLNEMIDRLSETGERIIVHDGPRDDPASRKKGSRGRGGKATSRQRRR